MISHTLLKSVGAVTLMASLMEGHAYSHDYWSNNTKVPDWVKSSCCGKADAHLLDPSQVSQASDSHGLLVWRVHLKDGRVLDIPYNQTLPSQDSNYWIFVSDAPHPPVYCFFAPLDM